MRTTTMTALGLFAVVCLACASCERKGAATPTTIDLQWPDAAPYNIGPQPYVPPPPNRASPQSSPAPEQLEPDPTTLEQPEPRQPEPKQPKN